MAAGRHQLIGEPAEAERVLGSTVAMVMRETRDPNDAHRVRELKKQAVIAMIVSALAVGIGMVIVNLVTRDAPSQQAPATAPAPAADPGGGGATDAGGQQGEGAGSEPAAPSPPTG